MINIQLLNENPGSSRAYKIAIDNRAAGTCRVVEDDSADIGILDIDSYRGDDWKAVRDRKHFPVILISGRELGDEKLLIRKPVKFSELLCLVSQQADKGMDETGTFKAASLAAGQIKDESRKKVIRFTRKNQHFIAKNYIVGYLSKLIKSQNTKEISLFQWKNMWLLVDGASMTVWSNINRALLNHLSVMPLKEISHKNLSWTETAPIIATAKLSDSIENMIWSMTPYISGQGLPHDLDINESFSLQTWPNFTQYPSSSEHLAVASHWYDNASSISDMASLFNLEISELASFITSCHLCGFLASNEVSTNFSTPEQSTSGMSRIFGMMLKKLSA